MAATRRDSHDGQRRAATKREVEPRTTLVDFLRGDARARPARTSAASTASAAPARCCGTARRCARASCSPCRPTARAHDGRRPRPTTATLHPIQQAFLERARPAVRLLHAGLPDVDLRAARPRTRAERRGDQGHARRQHLPLHGLPDDRRVGAARRVEKMRAPNAAREQARCRRDPEDARGPAEQRAALHRQADRSASRTRLLLTGHTEFIDNVVAARHAPLRDPAEPARRTRASRASTRARPRSCPASCAVVTGEDAQRWSSPLPTVAAGLGRALPRDRQGALRRRAGGRGRGDEPLRRRGRARADRRSSTSRCRRSSTPSRRSSRAAR